MDQPVWIPIALLPKESLERRINYQPGEATVLQLRHPDKHLCYCGCRYINIFSLLAIAIEVSVLYWQRKYFSSDFFFRWRTNLPAHGMFSLVLRLRKKATTVEVEAHYLHTSRSLHIGIFVIAKVIAFRVLSALMCLYSLSKMLCKSRSIGLCVAQKRREQQQRQAA
jgi:ABC-type long-subunit fatty acid transport system fused permease/ATPase subunit